MVMNSSKILTVSYGTFSCTLEGFDDSFDTMKAIAEYFRDLAADDRYFGAEPPTPDAEMLARIAEKEISRRVEARMEQGGIVLRQLTAMPGAEAPAAPEAPKMRAAAPAASPAPAAPPAQPAQDRAPRPEAVAPMPEAADPAEAPQERRPAAQAPMGDSVAAKLQRIRAVVSRGAAAMPDYAPDYSEDEHAEELAGAPHADVDDILHTDEAEDDARHIDRADAPMPAQGSGLHADAPAAVRAGLAQDGDDEDALGAAGAERSAGEAPVAVGGDSQPAGRDAAPEARDEAPATAKAGADDDMDDLDAMDALAAEATAIEAGPVEAHADAAPGGLAQDGAEAEAARADAEDDGAEDAVAEDAVAEDAVAEDDGAEAVAEDAVAEDDGAEAVAEDAVAEDDLAEPVAEEAVAEDDGAEAVAEEPLDEAVAADAAPEEMDDEARIVAATRARLARRRAAQAEYYDDEDEDDESGADPQGAAAATGNVFAGEADADAPARRSVTVRARVLRMSKTSFDAAAAAPGAGTLSAEDEDALQRELRAVTGEAAAPDAPGAPADAGPAAAPQEAAEAAPDDSAEAPEGEDARLAHLRAQARKAVKLGSDGRAILTERSIEEGDSVSRLMDETASQMDEPESNRRRSAIAHLRAAVAATKAEKEAGPAKGAPHDDTEAYRDDLATAVRPRRPVAGGERSTPRPAEPRLAPLRLVAEQRVDAAASATVTPRRVAADMLDGPAPAGEIEGTFAEFAEEMGVSGLSELLEAAAAYLSFVEGREQFSRPQLMTKVRQVEKEDFSREDGLRSFGQLLRQGKIEKTAGGRFTVSERISFRPDERAVG